MVIPVDCAFVVDTVYVCYCVLVWYIPSVGVLVVGKGVLVGGDGVGVPVESN